MSPVGFCICVENTKIELKLLGGEASQRLVSHACGQQFASALIGRLHYLDTNSGTHGVTNRANQRFAPLIVDGYARQGTAYLKRLEGTFAMIFADLGTNQLFARRDPLGGFPIYFSLSGRRLAIGTSLSHVAQWMGNRQSDLEFQADYLSQSHCGGHELRSERTAYKNVYRLHPNELLTVDLKKFVLRKDCYWNWFDELPRLESERLENVAATYKELFTEAVAQRMFGRCAAHVSGGLDSTSVAYVATNKIAQGLVNGPLETISLVYQKMGVLAQERQAIEQSSQHRLMNPHYIEGDELLDYEELLNSRHHDEPWPWLGMAQTEFARARVAAECNVDSVLTGHGADDFHDLGPYHLQDFIARGRFLSTWKHAVESARAENCGVWSILYPFGIEPLVNRFRARGTIRRSAWNQMSAYSIAPWIRESYVRAVNLKERIWQAESLSPESESLPSHIRLFHDRIVSRYGDLGRLNITAPLGVLTDHPFLDPRSLKFLLSYYLHSTPKPRLQMKPILVESMRGTLPDSIRLRPKGGFFNEPHFKGIVAFRKQLEDLVLSADDSVDDWLHRDELINCIRQVGMGIGASRTDIDKLNISLSLLAWKRNQCGTAGFDSSASATTFPICA